MSEAIAPGTRIGDLDIQGILRMLPHRFPFLMIDRVVDIVAETSATGVKNVTANEPHFTGHFPGHPIMPGVLIIEAMAQTASVLVMATLGQSAEGKLVYFMTIDQARFRRPVLPGDKLMVRVDKQHRKLGVWKFAGRATVASELVAEAIISAKIMDS